MTIVNIFQLFIDFFSNQDLISKITLVIFVLLYTLFTIILARQVFIMSELVDQIDFSPLFRLIAVAHVLLAVALFIFIILLV